MMLPETAGLCDTAWLAARLESSQVCVVDGSFFLPGSGRNPRDEFCAQHIPGAIFFDIDDICDPESQLPHMLPSPEAFGAKVQSLGITNAHLVVAYDAPGSAAAARVWWMFRVFGHDRVVILDGGLAKWLAEGRPVVAGDPPAPVPAPSPSRRRPARRLRGHRAPRTPQRYIPGFRPALVRSADEVLRTVATGEAQLIDARSPDRYRGVEAEPRPSLRQGHVPGSLNLPFSAFLDPERLNSWRSESEIADLFTKSGVDLELPMVCYCGSGITACVAAFAAFRLGHQTAAVYDGSWAEWGNRDDTPITT